MGVLIWLIFTFFFFGRGGGASPSGCKDRGIFFSQIASYGITEVADVSEGLLTIATR